MSVGSKNKLPSKASAALSSVLFGGNVSGHIIRGSGHSGCILERSPSPVGLLLNFILI